VYSALLAAAFALLPLSFTAKTGDAPGVWSAAASLATGRTGHIATLLRDGRVLLVGGEDGLGQALASATVFDPRLNLWRPAASMRTARVAHSATLLPDGRVLVAGGFTGGDSLESMAGAEIYDPAADRWKDAAPMLYPRARHTATLLPGGKVLVVGGIGPISEAELPSVAELYDPAKPGTPERGLPQAAQCDGVKRACPPSGPSFPPGSHRPRTAPRASK